MRIGKMVKNDGGESLGTENQEPRYTRLRSHQCARKWVKNEGDDPIQFSRLEKRLLDFMPCGAVSSPL
jgi:hypothetical protein